jgi:hypothetical protein
LWDQPTAQRKIIATVCPTQLLARRGRRVQGRDCGKHSTVDTHLAWPVQSTVLACPFPSQLALAQVPHLINNNCAPPAPARRESSRPDDLPSCSTLQSTPSSSVSCCMLHCTYLRRPFPVLCSPTPYLMSKEPCCSHHLHQAKRVSSVLSQLRAPTPGTM